jgi:glycosyltransferase involved in cell wall biosynthesis
MKPLVSVIVPCRNEEKYISLCIESILENDYGKENIEVIIVDGMSNDKSLDQINLIRDSHKDWSVRVIINEKRITPIAFNLGIKNANGEFILIVGSRHVIANNYISTCYELLNQNPGIGCVGSVVEPVFDSVNSEMIAFATSSAFGVGPSFRTQADIYVDTVGTPFYKKEIFEKIGYFDEILVRNQDDELNYRLRKSGHKIFITSKTSMKYYARTRFKDLYKQYFQYGYWKVFVNKKHKAVTTLRQIVPAIFVLFIFAGAALSLLMKGLYIPYLGVIFLYLFTGLVFCMKKTRNIRSIGKILFAFIILHGGYGVGYWDGILDFIILNYKPNPKHTALSR